jgi:hypothetical protein
MSLHVSSINKAVCIHPAIAFSQPKQKAPSGGALCHFYFLSIPWRDAAATCTQNFPQRQATRRLFPRRFAKIDLFFIGHNAGRGACGATENGARNGINTKKCAAYRAARSADTRTGQTAFRFGIPTCTCEQSGSTYEAYRHYRSKHDPSPFLCICAD